MPYAVFQIDRRFGYFPKDAVKVDEIYANTEKEVATQVIFPLYYSMNFRPTECMVIDVY